MNFGYPLDLYIGVTLGFFATVAVVLALDIFGDAMFRKGVARPFFVGRYRLHHRTFLYGVVPGAYIAIAAMVLTGFVKIEWSLLWTGLVGTVLVAIDCLMLDMTFDYFRKGRSWGVLRHELVYMAVPTYAFVEFLRIVI